MLADIVEFLVCPIHRGSVACCEQFLICAEGCRYPIVSGVPFLLPQDVAHTHTGLAEGSFALARQLLSAPQPRDDEPSLANVDQVVQDLVAHTNSTLYRPLVGRLERYPIPPLPMVPSHTGARLLDIGCGWGRWCIAAAQHGFLPFGIDLSLEATLAAKRVAKRLGVNAMFVVGDSRYLPFRTNAFDAAFSYSVLQHFSSADVRATLHSLAPTLRPGAVTKLHMLNCYGLRSLQVQLVRHFREARGFETRYWSPSEMLRQFGAEIGPSSLEIDGFFVQGRYEDRELFKRHHRALVEVSRALTRATRWLPFLKLVADNVFVVSRKAEPFAPPAR